MSWDLSLIFFILTVVIPWRGRVKIKKLLAQPHVSTVERLSLYAATIAFQWLLASLVAWRAWVHGYTAGQLGMTGPPNARLFVVGFVGGVTIATLQWFNLRRVGRMPIERRGPLVAIADRIFPKTFLELLPYFALAITWTLRRVSVPGLRDGGARSPRISGLGSGRCLFGYVRSGASLSGT